MNAVISMTTIPSRLKTLKPTLDSLLKQTERCPQIWINMPPNCAEFWQDANGELYPDGWRGKYRIDDERIKVNYMNRDFGPVTKLGLLGKNGFGHTPHTPAELRTTPIDDDTLIITVDDDIFYKPTWLATILEATKRWPEDVIGFSGWNVGGFLEGTGSYQFAGAPSFCDVIEGWAGVAYRKRFFDGIEILQSPPEFQFVDDVWISSQMMKKGIRRRLIAHPQAMPIDKNAPGLHTRLDFVELNRHAVRSVGVWK